MSENQIDHEKLYDCLISLFEDIEKLPSRAKPENFKNFIESSKKDYQKITNIRTNVNHFEKKKLLGKGGYGDVYLVKKNNNYYAMKCTRKADISKDNGTDGFMAEKEILAHGKNTPYIIQLRYSFQDSVHLYYVMDFMQGGDLQNLIYKLDDKLNDGSAELKEYEANLKFYAGEIINGINAIHEFGYIHRDIKPANVLLGTDGHLKMGDFGTCLKMVEGKNKIQFRTGPGTLDYVAPEVLKNAVERKHSYYGPELDWWAFGIMLYEMLVGETPFYDDDENTTRHMIQNHQNSLKFPSSEEMGFTISPPFIDLIKNLLTSRGSRLGRHGGPLPKCNIKDITEHQWFSDVKWTFDNIRMHAPPYVEISAVDKPDDTTNFEDFEEDRGNSNNSDMKTAVDNMNGPKSYQGENLQFVGFSYNTIPEHVIPSSSVGGGDKGQESAVRPGSANSLNHSGNTIDRLQAKEHKELVDKLKTQLHNKEQELISKETELSQLNDLTEVIQKKLDQALVLRDQMNQDNTNNLNEVNELR